MTNAAASPGGPVPLVLPPVKVSIEADATALTTGLAEATAAVEVLEAAMRRIGIPAADVPTAAQVTATVPTGVQRGIRTAIASGVGFVAAYCLTHFGWHISGADEGAAIGALTAAATTGYTALALYLERRYSWARALLGFVGN